MKEGYRSTVAVLGAAASYLLGGWSALLSILLVFVATDYVTGFVAAALEGKLSSAVGYRGIAKKIGIFVLVAMAHLVDSALGSAHFFRDACIFFYLANELLSVIENLGRIGLPIPDVIKRAVEILKGKSEGQTNGA